MRVLIITPYYYPLENPRAYRWSQIVLEWLKKGWEVEVITAHDGLSINNDRQETITRIGYSTPDKRFSLNTSPSRVASAFPRLKQLFRLLQWPDESASWISSGFKASLRTILQNKPDVVITVSWPFSTHLIGRTIKQQQNLPWLVDIGDPYWIGNPQKNEKTFLFHKKRQKAEKDMLELADKLVVTTSELQQAYSSKIPSIKNKITAIGPMLSPTPTLNNEKSNNNILRIGYFGSFYDIVRTPHGIKGFVQKLKTSSIETPIEFHIYGNIKHPDKKILQRIFDQTAITLNFHGWVNRTDVRLKMQSVDILLNIGNRSVVQIPSKLPDYLASGKPIVHLKQIKNDPCLPYLDKNHFIFSKENGKGLSLFLKNSIGQSVDLSYNHDLTQQWTPTAISEEYASIIEDLV